MVSKSPLFQRRTAGVLLHPTSLPCSETCCVQGEKKYFGTLGRDAYAFVDFMAAAGFSIWQMLPTGPTQNDMSPYQSISAHAGNPNLISLDWLAEHGWIESAAVRVTQTQTMAELRCIAAGLFYEKLASEQGAHLREKFTEFCNEQHYWLEDFALFSAIRVSRQEGSWIHWPDGLRAHEAGALLNIKKELKAEIDQVLFEQFAFFSQWHALKKYANDRGILLFGDMPIFVGHDSSDVWAQQHYFNLDSNGNPLTVAGVPPDYFSETGQHWGNPHYRWEAMSADGFQWWLARLRTQLHLFDLIRVDHFRGFEAFWEIPAGSTDARSGRWVKAPGAELLNACFDAFPQLPLVAENLGLITDEVEALRRQFKLPGMLVLQFGFDGNSNNPHLPHNHRRSEVIYTGTHDNDTTLGWYETLAAENRQLVKKYFFNSQEPMPWLLIEAAFSSVGNMTIIPMQDLLELDGGHRMNMPGTTDKNWVWTFSWDQVDPTLAGNIRKLLNIYHRLDQ